MHQGTVDFSRIKPELMTQFVNICPVCGVHSFFSPMSLELHKSICSKILQQEWIAYSKISILTKQLSSSADGSEEETAVGFVTKITEQSENDSMENDLDHAIR